MLKKMIMILTVVSIVISVCASEEAPKGWWWTRWRSSAHQKKQIKQQEATKKMLWDEMQAEWKKVDTVLNQQIQTLSDALGDVDPDEVKARLNDLDRLKKDAFNVVAPAITAYTILYRPEKLLNDHAFLQEDDTVVQKARAHADQANTLLDKFDEYLVARLKNIKRKKQQPPRPKAIVERLQEDWLAETNEIAEMLGKSAARIATRLNIDVPSNKGEDELTALLLTCSDLIKAEQDELQKMVDAFESKWRERLKRYASKDTQEARDQLNHFLTVFKPDLMNNFQQKIVGHWKDPRMHEHPHVQGVGEEFKN